MKLSSVNDFASVVFRILFQKDKLKRSSRLFFNRNGQKLNCLFIFKKHEINEGLTEIIGFQITLASHCQLLSHIAQILRQKAKVGEYSRIPLT